MDELIHCNQTWFIIQTTPLEFGEIKKETMSHGYLYMVYDDLETFAFVCQSGPVLVKAIFRKTGVKLNYSAIYRLLKGQTPNNIMKKRWRTSLFRRNNLEEFNNYLKRFSYIFFITKNPDLYILTQEPVECQSSERTFLTENEQVD